MKNDDYENVRPDESTTWYLAQMLERLKAIERAIADFCRPVPPAVELVSTECEPFPGIIEVEIDKVKPVPAAPKKRPARRKK